MERKALTLAKKDPELYRKAMGLPGSRSINGVVDGL